jgi:hypothetical protein
MGNLLEGRAGLRISDLRRASIEIHSYLRELITSGAVPPGAELKQTGRAGVRGEPERRRDAHMLADMVRTDSHQLRPAAGDPRRRRASKWWPGRIRS